MVKVVYHRDLSRVSITGHARSGDPGQDLVCASVSTLVFTLAVFVKNMHNAGQIRYPSIKLDEGDALIACEPPRRYKSSVTLVFDSLCAGFELLARDHPDNISYEIRGKI